MARSKKYIFGKAKNLKTQFQTYLRIILRFTAALYTAFCYNALFLNMLLFQFTTHYIPLFCKKILCCEQLSVQFVLKYLIRYTVFRFVVNFSRVYLHSKAKYGCIIATQIACVQSSLKQPKSQIKKFNQNLNEFHHKCYNCVNVVFD